MFSIDCLCYNFFAEKIKRNERKSTMKKRILPLLLIAAMLLPLLASCGGSGATSGTTEGGNTPTNPPVITTTEEGGKPYDPPILDPNASVYSGTPDTSWYTGDKTEYTLTTADQLVGFHSLRSESFNYEGITVKLDCDVILNPGTAEEIKARGSENHAWRQLNSAYLFKGTFDGQGHTISGLYMQLGTSAVRGMFGGVGGNAVIKNFSLINSYYGGPSGQNKVALGAIAAKISGEGANVTISNVTVDAILEEGTELFSRVGGFVGQAAEPVTLNMENCTFNGAISISGSYAGGMIGYACAAGLTVNMKNCTNYGTVKSATFAGGMTGILTVDKYEQSNCHNFGTVTATHDAGDLNGRLSIMTDPTNGARPTAPEGTTALRVMSFNVQGALPSTAGLLNPESRNRIEAVRQEILFYDPDLLGLQEDNTTWNTQIKLDGYNVIWDPATAAESAIYYKKGLKLLDSGAIWLTADGTNATTGLTYKELSTPGSKYYMTPEELEILDIKNDADLLAKKKIYVDQKTGEKKEYSGTYVIMTRRRVTWGIFDINGQTVIYLNTHLTHRSPSAEYSNDAFQKARSMERLKEFDLIHAQIDELKKTYPDALVFMTGDWNDLPNTPIYNSIVNDYGYVCANFNSLEKYGVDGSWNNAFNLDKQGDNYPSTKEGTPGSYLDYLFMDKEIQSLKFRVGAGKATITAVDGSTKTIYTSDHLPIITDICFKTPKTGSPIDPNYKDPSEPAPKDPTVYSGVPDTSWYTGDKTEYTLTSADQLMGFQALRAQQASFEGVTIKLGCDVTINKGTMEEIIARGGGNYAWAQLNSAYFFKGAFDGQGHTIRGLYMQLGSSAVRGMFGGVSGNAVIKNFTLENSFFGGPSQNKSTLGCIIAKVSSGANVTVSDITVKNTTMLEKMGTLSQIGGLVGVVETGCTLTVENCEFGGFIEFGTKGTRVGGIVGAAASSATVTLNGCTFSGSIQAVSEAGEYLGYEAGGSTVQITNCTSIGKLS